MEYFSQNKTACEAADGVLGVLLTNLGTPDAPTPTALRRYLRQFLSDPRVIEIPKWRWWPILHGIILRVRPAKSAALYASVWTDQGSPLLTISKAQQERLQTILRQEPNTDARVALGMRYGNPDIDSALRDLQSQGATKIIVLPLYPQYAGATTGSTFDAVADALKRFRWVPELVFINGYYDHPEYIEALANSIEKHFAQHGKPEKLLLSYHGMPQRYSEQGDPYYRYCQATSRLVAARLHLQPEEYVTCFQSRFGREVWLKPYTDEALTELARSGVKSVAVACPGFSADCLETIEEIGVENRKVFMDAGGQNYSYVAALNDRPDHLQMIRSLVRPYL